MNKVLLSAAGLVVLAGSYVAYPYYSVNRLGDAVQAGNEAQLEALVDWPSVGRGLKADLNILLAGAVTQTVGDGPGRALGHIVLEVLGPKVIENAVETYTTPAGFVELIRRGGEIDIKGAAARTIAAMSGPNGIPAPAPLTTDEPLPGGGDIAVADDADGMMPQPENFSVKVKKIRFVGINMMEVEFLDPLRTAATPVKGILTLEGVKWKLTRLILPANDVVDAPQTATRPQ